MNLLKLKDLSSDLWSDLLKDDVTKLNPMSNKNYNNDYIAKSINDLRNDDNEPKVYHSDFYYWKYMYDSFSKVVANEKYLNSLQAIETTNEKTIRFYMTRTINSRFMFDFTFFATNHFDTEDYEKYLIIQRNNEEVLYSSPYINYIRSLQP